MAKPVPYLLLIAATFLFSACLKEVNNDEIVCDPVEPYVPFRVVDQSSGADLFFNGSPKYQLKELNVFKIKDQAYQDTIKPKVVGTGIERVFLIPFDYSKAKDTLVIKIADTPADLLIYTVKKANSICEGHQLDQVYFNTTAVTGDKGVLVLKK